MPHVMTAGDIRNALKGVKSDVPVVCHINLSTPIRDLQDSFPVDSVIPVDNLQKRDLVSDKKKSGGVIFLIG